MATTSCSPRVIDKFKCARLGLGRGALADLPHHKPISQRAFATLVFNWYIANNDMPEAFANQRTVFSRNVISFLEGGRPVSEAKLLVLTDYLSKAQGVNVEYLLSGGDLSPDDKAIKAHFYRTVYWPVKEVGGCLFRGVLL